jgi:hypothetical protein
MDPYLEDVALWPSFQHAFVACMREALQSGLPDPYQSRVGERRYQEQGEQCEEYLEIVCRSDGQLVTLLDLVSPSNKTSAVGREECLRTRRQANEAGANVVELDLVLQGRPLLEYSRDGLPAWDYAVTVMRASHPVRYEIYTSTLQKRLPRFRVPLAARDPDSSPGPSGGLRALLRASQFRCPDQLSGGASCASRENRNRSVLPLATRGVPGGSG